MFKKVCINQVYGTPHEFVILWLSELLTYFYTESWT